MKKPIKRKARGGPRLGEVAPKAAKTPSKPPSGATARRSSGPLTKSVVQPSRGSQATRSKMPGTNPPTSGTGRVEKILPVGPPRRSVPAATGLTTGRTTPVRAPGGTTSRPGKPKSIGVPGNHESRRRVGPPGYKSGAS